MIKRRLGDGATGTVYLASHVKFTRSFAIKVLHKSLMGNPKQVKRFERESELAGRLRHTNVASVVDVGATDDGQRYAAMEFAAGEPLTNLIADGPMSEARALDLAKQICHGLAHAHDVGLIHRDLKPDNVIVEQPRGGREVARIVDFGVAILREDAADLDGDRLTTKGIVVGTPHYMAPEQASGAVLDPRVDLFALGLTTYEMLTGVLPFDGSGVDIARENLMSPTPAMKDRVPGVKVDPVLEAVVRKLLEKDPAARPASANAARELFELYERDRPACARLLGVELKTRMKMAALERPAESPPSARDPELEPPESAAPESAPRERDLEINRPTHEVASQRSRRLLVLLVLAFASAFAIMIWLARRADDTPAHAMAPPAIDAMTETVEVVRDARVEAITTDLDGTPTPVVVPGPGPGPAPGPGPGPGPGPTRIAVGSNDPVRLAPPLLAPLPAEAPAATTTRPPPSGAEVARLYAEVGRELNELEDKKGMDVTIDLWPRYRWIRLNEWLLTQERRVRAVEMLEQLQREIRAQL